MTSLDSGPMRFEALTPRVPVRRLEEALSFHRDRFGFALGWKWGAPATHANVGRDAISWDPEAAPLDKCGMVMAYVQVRGVDAYRQELKSPGVTLSEHGDRVYGVMDVGRPRPSIALATPRRVAGGSS